MKSNTASFLGTPGICDGVESMAEQKGEQKCLKKFPYKWKRAYMHRLHRESLFYFFELFHDFSQPIQLQYFR